MSRFVPKLAEKTKPIVEILKKVAKFNWNPKCKEIFLQLEAFLTAPPVIQKLDN